MKNIAQASVLVDAQRFLRKYPFQVHMVIFLCVSWTAFVVNEDVLFMGFDGAFFFQQATACAEGTWNLVEVPFDPLMGMYSIGFPICPVIWKPIALLSSSTSFGPVLGYVATALACTCVAWWASRAVGMGLAGTLATSWLTPLILLPYSWPPFIYPLAYLSPSVLIGPLLLMATIPVTGEVLRAQSVRRAVVVSSLYSFVLFTTVLGMPISTPFWLPFVIVLWVASALVSQSRPKSLLVASAVLAPTITAALLQSLPLLANSGSRLLSQRLLDQGLDDPTLLSSLLFAGIGNFGWIAPFLGASVALGSVRIARNGDRQIRTLAVTLIAIWLITILIALGTKVLIGRYYGPSPRDFEYTLLPSLCLLACWTPCRKYRVHKVDDSGLSPAALRVGLVAALTVLAMGVAALDLGGQLLSGSKREDWRASWPLREGQFSYLTPVERSLALGSNDEPFRGFLATIGPLGPSEESTWPSQNGYDSTVARTLGSDPRSIGPWRLNVPTVFAYSQVLPAPTFKVIISLLASQNAKQTRNVQVLNQPQSAALDAMGVSRVLSTNMTLPKEEWASTLVSEELSLYYAERIKKVWPSVSPVFTETVADLDEMLAKIEEGSFDRESTTLVFSDANARYAPTNYQIRQSSTRVTVEVAGGNNRWAKSLIPLPYQFSRCWKVNSPEGQPASLVRVNVNQVGLLVTGSGRYTLRAAFSLLDDPLCLWRDQQDSNAVLGAG